MMADIWYLAACAGIALLFWISTRPRSAWDSIMLFVGFIYVVTVGHAAGGLGPLFDDNPGNVWGVVGFLGAPPVIVWAIGKVLGKLFYRAPLPPSPRQIQAKLNSWPEWARYSEAARCGPYENDASFSE